MGPRERYRLAHAVLAGSTRKEYDGDLRPFLPWLERRNCGHLRKARKIDDLLVEWIVTAEAENISHASMPKMHWSITSRNKGAVSQFQINPSKGGLDFNRPPSGAR